RSSLDRFSAHSRESGNPELKTGSPLSRGRADVGASFAKNIIAIAGKDFVSRRWSNSARGLPTHLGDRAAHGLDDVLVAGAAAEIGREKIENVIIREVGIRLQRIHRQHQKTRRTEPALKRVMLDECALYRMQLVAVGEAFDRADALALRLDREHQAGPY